MIQEDRGPFYIASPAGTRLDDVATETLRAAPDEIARFGFAVAHALEQRLRSLPVFPREAQALARNVAEALQQSQTAAGRHGRELRQRRGSRGRRQRCLGACAAWDARPISAISAAGMQQHGSGAARGRQPCDAAAEAVSSGSVETVIVLENDLFRRMGSTAAEALLEGAKTVIAVDHLANETTEKATIVLAGQQRSPKATERWSATKAARRDSCR